MSARYRAWQISMARLLAWVAVCTITGAALGHVWAGLSFGLAGALAWHYYHIAQLLRRLAERRAMPPAESSGLLSEVQDRIYRRQLESRRRKQSLQLVLRAFREAAAALPDAVVVVAARDHKIAWFNDAAVELLGLRRQKDIGMRINNLLRHPRIMDWLTAEDSDPLHEVLWDVPSPRDASIRLSMRMVEYTQLQRLLIVRDISRLIRLEQVRRDFVANVSHELRTPLTVIHGYLSAIDADDHPELAELLGEMSRQSERMQRIVEDLLTLSRLESQQTSTQERVPVAALLQTLIREAEALSAGRHHIELHDNTQLDLLGSPKELHSAFSNLVSNAVRYTPAGGTIALRFDGDRQRGACFSVSDTGPGIAAEHIPRITERFYRVSNSRSRETGGTGLGLAIVKHALALHSAQLDIRSELGKGTQFSCVFDPQHVAERQPSATT
ncbi:phosphate regulon sensor histidine kinase PhoR [Pseudomarimonas arenosa]|uniref:Phosphate regulon sensor protein PhoR n=1 Tax=Pseudomarimonas arenosa TaxID=2774145 RepID=A0AAW3ZN01_9GAMM|nr:phosphate regulon sensor histidine kinase PhoR [Pseudomarimonas arenosa]MBD8526019.1 phosphate regulon sensor histidine kinase PhoR [Pseudomarimonas arenosa]